MSQENSLTANLPYGGAGISRAEGIVGRLKMGIWGYFLLLIFEGALRKWFLPGLATPLLIVRDPLAMWLIFETWRYGLLPRSSYLVWMMLIGGVATCTASIWGHGSLPVALYGGRIFFFHFPLIFLIGCIFNRDDVVKIGKVTLWIALPMVLLIALQFYSPQSAWVNRGVGGDMEGAGFSGALGYFRPPGTFSFTNGNTLFFELVACFVFYFWLNAKEINKLLLICATLGLVASIPLSISRGLTFSIGVTLIFLVIASSRKPKYIGPMIMTGLGLGIALAFLSRLSLFQTATEVILTRFESAGASEGGVVEGTLGERYVGGMVNAIFGSSEQPFFGYGLGMGTNVGSMLLTGNTKFLISEGEWGRLIGELGPLMGLAVIVVRLSFSAKLALASYRKLSKGDVLPWMLLSFGLLTIPQSQWGQPTTLGFSVMIGGLILASLRMPQKSSI